MFKLTVCFGILVFLAVVHGDTRFLRFDEIIAIHSNESNAELTDKQLKYNLLTITQAWPQTACWELNRKWTNNTSACSPCDMPESKTDWTIHGLWPSNSKGKHPSYCSNTKFNIKQLNKTLIAQMEEKWSTFNLKNDNEYFWKHEWDKHGTCASDLPSTNTLPKYFSKSIQLLDQYNAGKILAEAGILPGKKYDYQDVAYVIEETLGVQVDIDCAVHSVSKEAYLNEIRVCLNKSFELINCPVRISDCKRYVWYPEIRPECGKV